MILIKLNLLFIKYKLIQESNNKMNPSRTLWMGNIEQWMTEEYIINIFISLNLHPQKINILKKPIQKRMLFHYSIDIFIINIYIH